MSDTERRPARRLLTLIESTPLLITDDGRELLFEIAARDNLITEEVLIKIATRKEALAAKRAARMDGADVTTVRDGVALIDVNGPIFRYADFFTRVSGGTTTESLATDFTAALNDPSVRGIVFVFDSPGGEAAGINELGNMIYGARGDKPIGGYIGGAAGSASYWIASAVDPGLLWIDETAFAGSIGAIVGMRKKSHSDSVEAVSDRAPKKRINPETESGMSELKAHANALESVFVSAVARNRSMTPEAVTAAEGRMVIGSAAVKSGLADRLGSLEGLISEVRSRASDHPAAFDLSGVTLGADFNLGG